MENMNLNQEGQSIKPINDNNHVNPDQNFQNFNDNQDENRSESLDTNNEEMTDFEWMLLTTRAGFTLFVILIVYLTKNNLWVKLGFNRI